MEQGTKQFDTVLLAGDTGASRMVCNSNKSFLTINEVPLLMYVLRALEKAETVNRICIIGPQDRVVQTLEDHHGFLDHKKEITVCAQDETLFANAWKAFLHLTPEAQGVAPENTGPAEKAVFYLSGDIPLVTPLEIDTFISLCDTDRYDYFLGIAPAENLTIFIHKKVSRALKQISFTLKRDGIVITTFNWLNPLKLPTGTTFKKFMITATRGI